MTKKYGMTLENHRRLGTAIKVFEKEIWEVIASYPVTSTASRTASRTKNLLLRLKSVMESQMFVDIPGVGETDFISVYYDRAKQEMDEVADKKIDEALVRLECQGKISRSMELRDGEVQAVWRIKRVTLH